MKEGAERTHHYLRLIERQRVDERNSLAKRPRARGVGGGDASTFGINPSPMVTVAYVLAAAVLIVMSVYRKRDNELIADENEPGYDGAENDRLWNPDALLQKRLGTASAAQPQATAPAHGGERASAQEHGDMQVHDEAQAG